MSAEIYEFDNVVLTRESAWHGLGVVVPEHLTPRKALALIGDDSPVKRQVLYFRDSFGNEHEVPTHAINTREIPGQAPLQYGVVSADYQIIQPIQMAQFCESLLDEGQGVVKCETVGTIRNGARIWFLLKGEDFSVANGDGIFPYIAVSNGHDGKTAFRVTPTTVRVVCQNTLHMVVPRFETGTLEKSAIMLKHTTNIMERVEQAKYALKHYTEVMDEQKILMNRLSRRDVSTEQLQKFFAESYTADFGEIPTDPKSKVEENRKARAASAWASFSKRFDDEKPLARASWWNAFNAYSGMVQHDGKARGADDTARVEDRVNSNLFGLSQERTHMALQRAFRMSATVA